MASRSKQRASPTPEAVSSSDPGSRPASPTNQLLMSRRDEKLHMQNLNDRFASLLDRQRQLEIENQQLTTRIERSEETYVRETMNVKAVYEKQLDEVRIHLDAVSNEKAKLTMDYERVKSENGNVTGQLAKQNKDLAALSKKLTAIEAEQSQIKHQLYEESERRKKAEEDRNNARKEVDTALKQLGAAQKQLEAETLGRIEVENKNRSLEERIAFVKNVHEEELNQSRTSQSVVVETHVQQLQEEFQAQKGVELQELREECEERFTLALNDLELRYESQVEGLKANLAAKVDTENRLRTDLQSVSSKVQSYDSKIHTLENNIKSLKDRIKDLEDVLNQERLWNTQGLQEKDRAIVALQDQLKQQLQEYKELYDVKVGLDMEIGTYRKLVEGEEKRLSVASSPFSSPSSSRSASFLASSPLNVSRGSKRKVVFEETYETDVHTDAHTNCDIEINDHDVEGHYVQVTNKSDKDISLSGWQLVRKSGRGPTNVKTTYRFHRSLVMKPKAVITVWSASSKKDHNPPADLVMKTQSWFVAPEMSTVLIGPNAETMATRETKRTTAARKRRLTGDAGGGAEDARCSIT